MKFCTSISVCDSRQQTHPKIHKKYELPAFPHPESHEFLKPLIYLQLETRESPKVNPERHEFPVNALIDPCQLLPIRKAPFQILHYLHYAPTFKTIFVTLVLSRPYLKFNQLHSMTPFYNITNQPHLLYSEHLLTHSFILQTDCDRF